MYEQYLWRCVGVTAVTLEETDPPHDLNTFLFYQENNSKFMLKMWRTSLPMNKTNPNILFISTNPFNLFVFGPERTQQRKKWCSWRDRDGRNRGSAAQTQEELHLLLLWFKKQTFELWEWDLKQLRFSPVGARREAGRGCPCTGVHDHRAVLFALILCLSVCRLKKETSSTR